MIDNMERLIKLKQQGFFCSQIILIEGLEMMGKENPLQNIVMVRASLLKDRKIFTATCWRCTRHWVPRNYRCILKLPTGKP